MLIRFSTAAALAYTAYAMCRAPVLPLYARELGAGPELVGLVAGASTVTGVLLNLPAGAISDAVGRRAVLLTAAAMFALMPLVYPLVASVAVLVMVRFVHGSASALFGPAAAATLSDVAPANQRGGWLGTYAAIQGAGAAAGPVLAGTLLTVAGFAPTFLAAAIFGLMGAAVLVRLPVSAERRAVTSWFHLRTAVAAVAADRRILLTSGAQAGQFVLHGLITAFLPIYAVERAGISPAEAGWLFGAQMLTTIAARPLFGRVSDRTDRRLMIVLGLIVCALATPALTLATTFQTLLLVSATYGAGLAITTSSTAALITDLSDRGRYGAAHGLFGAIFDIGDAIGPIAGGIVAARLGYALTFQAAGALVIALAILFGVISRRWTIAQ